MINIAHSQLFLEYLSSSEESFTGFFNWTATYRDDSDIRVPYGWFEAKDRPLAYPPKWSDMNAVWKSIPFNKTKFIKALPHTPESFRKLAERPKLVIWVASHCQTTSKREFYVKKLSRYIQVSIPFVSHIEETRGFLSAISRKQP